MLKELRLMYSSIIGPAVLKGFKNKCTKEVITLLLDEVINKLVKVKTPEKNRDHS